VNSVRSQASRSLALKVKTFLVTETPHFQGKMPKFLENFRTLSCKIILWVPICFKSVSDFGSDWLYLAVYGCARTELIFLSLTYNPLTVSLSSAQLLNAER